MRKNYIQILLFAVIVFNKLTCSYLYDLILRYEARVNALRASNYFIRMRFSSVFHGEKDVFQKFMCCLQSKKDFISFRAVW